MFSLREPTEGAVRNREECFDRKWEETTNGLMWRNSRGTFRVGGMQRGRGVELEVLSCSSMALLKALHYQSSWGKPYHLSGH